MSRLPALFAWGSGKELAASVADFDARRERAMLPISVMPNAVSTDAVVVAGDKGVVGSRARRHGRDHRRSNNNGAADGRASEAESNSYGNARRCKHRAPGQ